MAKRKRLSPAAGFGGETGTEDQMGYPFGVAPTRDVQFPPVAQIAGDAAARAALDELAGQMQAAREGGRMVIDLPLGAVEATHLQRDRMHMDPEEMASLKASIRDRGQQMPIEVVALTEGRYGLVSGARRLAALMALHEETGDAGFATVKALLRPFTAAPEAYLAMVEENEIRADLSFYERGRLAHEAARMGVFDSPAAAVRMLFQHAPAPKRSKILSFVALHEALGNVLCFPEAIPERLGLALVKAMQADPALVRHLQESLQRSAPGSASAEREILEAVLRPTPAARAESKPAEVPQQVGEGILIAARPGRVVLTGRGVTDDFLSDLAEWLQTRE